MGYPTKKATLNTQTKKHFVVIRKNKELPMERLIEFLESYYEQWALIEHKGDIDPTTGIVIPTHYHYVGNYRKARTPLSTTLNEISKFFRFDNNNGLEIDQYNSLPKAIQYLIHKNNELKTPHQVSEIKYGGWTKEELDIYLTSDSEGITFDLVFRLCKDYENIIDVIRELGFTTYSRYRNAIKDIFFELHPPRSYGKPKEEQPNPFMN